MEWTSLGEADSAGLYSNSKTPHGYSYHLPHVKAEPPEAVGAFVKLEVMDEDDETSTGALQISCVGTVLPAAETSLVWPLTPCQADSEIERCPSYGDPTSGTSFPQEKDERLFAYETLTDVEERDPLADPGPPSGSGYRVILNDDTPSLDLSVIEIARTTASSSQHLLEVPKAVSTKQFNFASLTSPGATKLHEHPPSEGVKSYKHAGSPNSYLEVPVQELGMSSNSDDAASDSRKLEEELKALGIKRLNFASLTNPGAAKLPKHLTLEGVKSYVCTESLHSDGTRSESRRLEQITPERLKGLMAGVPSTLRAFQPTSYTSKLTRPEGSLPLPARKRKIPIKKTRACQTTFSAREKDLYTKMFAPSASILMPSMYFDKHQLDHRAKSIVYNVADYFQKKKKQYSLNYSVADVASGATNLPKTTVQSIITMGRRSLQDDPSLKLPTFARYHTEKCKNCGDVLVDFALREIIFNAYVEERRALIVKEISASLDEEELYVCKDFLRRRLRELGIDLMRCIATSGYVPLERPELAASRYRYFQDIEKHRNLHKQIVYVFEVDLSRVVHGKVTWEPLEGHPTKDDTQLMTVIHAARESGFIDGSLFVHSNYSRQHRKSMHPLSAFWLNSFLPKLAKGSVVVLGHNRHHFVRPSEPKPDASWLKQDIVEWLHKHQQESFSSSLPSAVLLEKVNTTDTGSKFGINDLVISNGHIPLHLPRNHRELNPIELVWRKILEKFPSIDIDSEEPMKDFLQKEFDAISPGELQEAFELSKNHEKRLRHLDMRIDEPVGEVIRRVGGVLGRDYALAEDESDGDASADEIQEGLLEKIAVENLEASKQKSKNAVSSSVQRRKKRKIALRSQCAIGSSDQIPLPMPHISPSSKKDCQEISSDKGESQESSLGGNLRTSDDMPLVQPKEERMSPTEEVGCIPVPQSSSPSWHASEGTSVQLNDSFGLLETPAEKRVDQPEIDVASSYSVPNESETTETASEGWSGPSSVRSPSDSRSECVADICDITLRNPIKEEEDLDDMFWEPTRQSLAPWSEELTEIVTMPEPPPSQPRRSKRRQSSRHGQLGS